MRRAGSYSYKKRLFSVFSDTSQRIEIRSFFDKVDGLINSGVAQCHEVFDILMDSHSFPRRISGIWEETDEKCYMERHVEKTAVCERVTPSHALGST